MGIGEPGVPEQGSPERADGPCYRILVADDDPAARIPTHMIMSMEGYEVIDAQDGVEAVDAFVEHRPDLVLLDAMMPEMDGFTACSRIRDLDEGALVPIVIITALDSRESIDRAFAMGATDCATKPIHFAALRHRVQRLLHASRAEEALRQSEARLRALMQTVSSAVLIAQEDRVRYANPAAEAITGHSQAELAAIGFWDLFDPAAREAMKAEVQAHSRRERPAPRREVRVLTRDGSERWVDITLQWTEYQAAPALLGTAVDITERKHMEARVTRAQRMAGLGTLAAGVAHEINSPLQVITGVSERLMSRLEQYLKDPERLKTDLGVIHRNSWRCAEIVRSLGTYAQVSSHHFELHDLNRLVRDALLLIEHQLKSWSGVSIECEFAEDMPPLACDRNRITQALINLLENARDSMPSGGRVTIRTRWCREDRRCVLEVADNGRGMPEAVLAKAFDPFFTTKPPGDGAGLGLSIVAGITQAHHGDIEARSEVGRGTTFTLSFDVGAEGMGDPSEQQAAMGRFDEDQAGSRCMPPTDTEGA